MRTKITIAYVGTRFAGWQRQTNAPSVQAEIERAAAQINGVATTVHGAGRTDTGVHAQGQVAHFDTDKAHSPDEWRAALNAHLPEDVRVMNAAGAADDFHARHSAIGKTYRYEIDTSIVASPFRTPFSWHVGPDLDVVALRAAAEMLLGPLDQRAFATQPEPGARTDRPLDSIAVETDGATVAVVVAGRSFLRFAVRGMVGTLVEVGRGKRTAESIRGAAASGDRIQAGATAPAHGLCLERVHYGPGE